MPKSVRPKRPAARARKPPRRRGARPRPGPRLPPAPPAAQAHRLPAGRVQQARHPWTTVLMVVLGAGLIVAALWILSASGVVANRFKPIMEREIAQALTRPVTIGKVEGGLFDHVVLRDVKIFAPASDPRALDITIDRVVVRYSLWDILVRRAPLAQSLREIQLIRPLLRFERGPDGHWRGPNLLSWSASQNAPPAVPAIKLAVYGGELRFTNARQSASLKNLHGSFNLRTPSAARLQLTARTENRGSKNVKVSGDINLLNGKLRLDVVAGRVRLRPFERVAPISPYLEILDGRANLDLHFVSRDRQSADLIPGVDLRGKLVLEDLSLKTPLLAEPIRSVYGVTLLDNDSLSIKNIQAVVGKTAWSGRGRIDQLQQPRVNVMLGNDHLQLTDVTSTFPRLARLRTGGTGQAAILIKGQVPALTVTGSLRLRQGNIGKMQIRNFESILRFSGQELRLLLARGTMARGWVEGKGRILFSERPQDPPAINFSLEGRNLAADDLGPLLGLERLRGSLAGKVAITGDLERPSVSGTISSPRLRAAGAECKNLSGTLALDRESLELAATCDLGALPSLAFLARLVRRDLGWSIKKMGISQQGVELLGAAGSFDSSPDGALDLTLRARSLPLAGLQFMGANVRRFNGRINLDGKLAGTWQQPQFSGRFSSRELIRAPGLTVDAGGEVETNGELITLKNISADRNRIRISGVVDVKKKQIIGGEIRLAQARLAALAFLGGLAQNGDFMQGLATGQIKLSGPWTQLRTSGSVGLAGLDWKGVNAQAGKLVFTSNGSRLWVKSLEFQQAEGRFNAACEADLGRQGALQLRVWLDKFRLAGRRWSGDVKIDSGRAGRANALRAVLENLEVDGRSLPELSARLSLNSEARVLTVEQADWGAAVAASGTLAWDKKPEARLALRLNHSRLGPLRALLARGSEPLAEALDGEVLVHWTPEQVSADARMRQGQGEWGGQLFAKSFGPGAAREYSASLNLKNVQMRSVLDVFLAGKPETFPGGTASGTVAVSQAAGAPDPDFALELNWDNFNFGEWHFLNLQAEAEKKGEVVVLKKLAGRQARGSLQAESGRLQKPADGPMIFDLKLRADRFKFIARHFTGQFHLQGTASLKEPLDIDVALDSPDFKLNLYPFGNFQVEAHYRGQDLFFQTPAGRPCQVSGHLGLLPDGTVEFKRAEIADALQKYVSVKGRLDGNGTSDLQVQVNNVPADIIARCLDWPQPWTGTCSGTIAYREPERSPHYTVKVKVENGSVLRLPFDSFVGTVLVEKDWLYFKGARENSASVSLYPAEDACLLRKEGKYTFYLRGRLPMPQSAKAAEAMRGAEMDVQVQMPSGDFSYILFLPYFSAAAGKSRMDLKIRGTLDYPSLYGYARVEDATLAPRLFTPAIDRLNAELTFDNNKVFIRRFDGRVNEGELHLAAGPLGPWAAVFRRLAPDELNLSVESKNGRIRLDATPDYEFVSAWLNARLTVAGTFDAPVFGGELELSDGQFTYPPRPLTAFSRELKGGNIQYDQLKCIFRKNCWFYNDGVRAQIKPDQSVVFNGGKNDFSGQGRVAVSRGNFTYLDMDFSLDPNEETALTFQGREKPRIYSLAKTTLRDVQIKDEGRAREATIYLKVTGALGALKIDLTSEPTMTQAQIMSLLTLGEDFSNRSQAEIDQSVQSAGARLLGRYAGNMLGREIEKNLKKIAPIDVVGVRLGGVEKLAGSIVAGENGNTAAASSASQQSGASLLQDTQIDLGKYLTNDLFLNYRATLKDRGVDQGGLSWESLLGLEYDIGSSRKLKLYKNFDPDSSQEFYWGIEGRTEFDSWKPSEAESASPTPTATPARKRQGR